MGGVNNRRLEEGETYNFVNWGDAIGGRAGGFDKNLEMTFSRLLRN